MGDSIPLVDLKARNHDIECGDLNRIHDTNGSIVQQILISVVQAMRGLFWDPFTGEAYTTIRSLKALNKQTRDHLHFLQYFIALNDKREGFIKTEEDVTRDKAALYEEMDRYEKSLMNLRETYKEKRVLQDSVHRIQSDIRLTLSKYERCSNCYSLYNNILDVIHKTLLSIDTTEKLKGLCGIVNSTNIFQSCGYSNMEDTVHKLVRDIAACEDAKSHIESQLSLARSKSIGVALHVGSEVDASRSDILTDAFLESGEIKFEISSTPKPSSDSHHVIQETV